MFYEGYNIDSEVSAVNIRGEKKKKHNFLYGCVHFYTAEIRWPNSLEYEYITLDPKL